MFKVMQFIYIFRMYIVMQFIYVFRMYIVMQFADYGKWILLFSVGG